MQRLGLVALLALVFSLSLSLSPASAQSGDAGLASALGAGAVLPVLNLNFSVNPATLPGVGATLNYGWAAADTTDTAANQALHQGVAILSGTGNSFINLSTLTGPQSCGQLLPLLGGASSGTGATAGWSFEFVFKPTGNTNTWAKLVDFGDGSSSGYYPSSNNDWTLGFDGSDLTQFLLETYNAGALTPNFTHGWVQMETLQVGTWYHITVVQTPVGSLGGANWYVYVNGALYNWAAVLNGGNPITVTPTQGANMPQPIPRSQAYIGKSNWNDPLLAATVDAIRIYDYALTQTQITALATLYNLNANAAGTGLNPQAYPAPGTQAANFASIQSTTAPEYALGTTLGFGFDPFFSAPFSQNPAPAVGGSTGYTWVQADPTDSAAVQAQHQGVILLNGTTNTFVDLVQVTGPNSIGQSLPILFGQSAGTGATYGWTVDVVFKAYSVQTWSKIFDLGTGANIDDIYFGWQSNSGVWEFGNIISTSNALASRFSGTYQSGSDIGVYSNVLLTPKLNTWYHLTWVYQPVSTDYTYSTASASNAANWQIYVNGQSIYGAAGFAGNAPLPIFRHAAYLGRSDWFQEGSGDLMINGAYDGFRVWNRALTSTQVASIANYYGILAVSANATGTGGQVTAGGDFGVATALAGGKLPVFNANFSVNPAQMPGVVAPTNYAWLANDPSDSSALQTAHQGLVSFNGIANFINLSTSAGPSSIGLTLPLLGTTSSSTTAPGWSFEFVWKPLGEQNTWAKLADFGNGASSGYYPSSNDDWTFGFDGNDQTEFLLETYNAGPGSGQPQTSPNFTHGWQELQTLVIGQWYHMVVVQIPVGTQGGANWMIYVNGALFNWAYPLNNQQPLTTSYLQGANMPLPNPRSQAYLGKSNWNDPYLACLIDSVRIYDYALSQAQVTALATLYSSTSPCPLHSPQPHLLPRRRLVRHGLHSGHQRRGSAGDDAQLRLPARIQRTLPDQPRLSGGWRDLVHLAGQ